MKANKIITFILASLLTFAGTNAVAQSGWVVNPNDYTYSMSISGQINTDGKLSIDVNDKIAAFINGQCRGVTNVKYISANGGYYVFLLIYSNDPIGTVSFKIWDNSASEEMVAKETLNFTVNDIVGSVSNPFLFRANSLKSEGKLLYFSIPNQSGGYQIVGNNVYVQEHWSGNLMGIKANFTLSDGAKAFVNGVEQTSGVSSNNFLSPVNYTVVSADLSSSTVYTVHISTANDIPTDIILSNNRKDENDNDLYFGTFRTVTDNPADFHVYSLVNAFGTENGNFAITNDELSALIPFNFEQKSNYNILVRADDQKGGIVDKYFYIEVMNVNEAPTGITILNTKIPVSVPANSIVSELKTQDQDIGDVHTFVLVTGDGSNDLDNSKFYIEGNLLKNTGSLIFLVELEYHLLIKTTDKAGLSVTVPLVLKNQNVGSSPTSLTLSNTSVEWTGASQVFVGTMTTEDIDQKTGHIFSLPENKTSGPDNSYFTIKSNNLFLSWSQPVPGKYSYSVLLSVADTMGHHFEKTFVIQIKENPNSAVYTISNGKISENQPENTIIGYFYSESQPGSNYTVNLPLEVNLEKYRNNDFKLNGRTLLTNKVFDFEKEDSVLIQIEVTNGLSKVTRDLKLGIVNLNDPPTGIKVSTQIFSESTALNTALATLSADDQDKDDTHDFMLVLGNGVNDEGNPLFKISGNKLILAKPLDYESKEFHNILLKVTDHSGATFEQGIRFQVADANDAPVFSGKPANFVIQDQLYIYAINATDIDGDTISVSFQNLPGWLTFNKVSNILTGVAGNRWVGDYNFSIKASDKKAETTQNISVSVINVNDAPEINYFIGDQEFITSKENQFVIPADCFIDPDNGDKLTFSVSMNNNMAFPSWLTFDAATRTLKGTPPKQAFGNYQLKLAVSDQKLAKEWMAFNLNVTFPTAIAQMGNAEKFSVYPNPVADFVNLSFPENLKNTKLKLRVTDVQGKVFKSAETVEEGSKSLYLGDLPAGVYFIIVQNEKSLFTEKIIKR